MYWNQKVVRLEQSRLEGDINFCRGRMAHDKKQLKILVSIARGLPGIEVAFVKLMGHIGATKKSGSAPAGNLERQVVSVLERTSR